MAGHEIFCAGPADDHSKFVAPQGIDTLTAQYEMSALSLLQGYKLHTGERLLHKLTPRVEWQLK